ncbi:MAG: hypothetical protein U9Q12_03900 [Patescibacteria group bacterium]|nr:hypothetical protein [Patescibacteria group bacterium]
MTQANDPAIHTAVRVLKEIMIARDIEELFLDDIGNLPKMCHKTSLRIEGLIREYARMYKGGTSSACIARALDTLFETLMASVDLSGGNNDGILQPSERERLIIELQKNEGLHFLYCLVKAYKSVPRI